MIGGFWFAAWHSSNVHTKKKWKANGYKQVTEWGWMERGERKNSPTIVVKWEMTVGTQMENGRKQTTEHSNNHRIESVGIDWISKCKRANMTQWLCVQNGVYAKVYGRENKNSFFFTVTLPFSFTKCTQNTHAIRRHWHYLIRFSWCDPNQLRGKSKFVYFRYRDSNVLFS